MVRRLLSPTHLGLTVGPGGDSEHLGLLLRSCSWERSVSDRLSGEFVRDLDAASPRVER